VVAFGTSAPELVVSVQAVLIGYPELTVANVVGSNIANVLLVIGVPAIVYPLVCDQKGVEFDGFFMLGASALFFALCGDESLEKVDGVILLLGLVVFLLYVLRGSSVAGVWSSESKEMPWVLGLPSGIPMIAVLLFAGIVALPLGAHLLIDGAVGVARALGIPNSVVGLTVIALSTSLPELATTLVAALKREADVAVGNVLGSNVLNVFAIMGVSVMVSPTGIPVAPRFLYLDLPVMLGTAIVLAVATWRRETIGRGVGSALFALYILYIFILFRPTA
jgi:cation:H+ antiporter